MTSENVTAQQVSELLLERTELDMPETVLAVLHAHEGKKLTKSLLAKLPMGEEQWAIRKIARMTYLESRPYAQSHGNKGVNEGGMSLLMAYGDVNVAVDTIFVTKHNPAYFDARKARNLRRMESRNDANALERMALVLNMARSAKRMMETARAEFEKLTEVHEGPFYPDAYELERLGGMRDDEKGGR